MIRHCRSFGKWFSGAMVLRDNVEVSRARAVVSFAWNIQMRTNIVIDDKLMAATLKATGIKSKREAVEQGLRALLRLTHQTELRKLRGKYELEGDMVAMRRDA